MKNKTLENVGIAGAVVETIVLLVLSPVLTFWLAYFGGWILQQFVGTMLINGMNLMLNTTRFTVDMIPLTCATLAVVGSYFKSRQTNNNK